MIDDDDLPNSCILYVFDSLRYDHVSRSGNSTTSPYLGRLAEDAIWFENAYSQAIWTYPSAASIFSGLYPETHQSQQFDQPLRDELPHLADGMKDVRTACFSTTLGVSPERGFKQEFDEFYHVGEEGNALRPDIMERLNDKLVPWIEEHAGEPFFVVVWAMGTHHPYVIPDDADDPTVPLGAPTDVVGAIDWLTRQSRDNAEAVRATYDRAVQHSDEKFGEMIDILQDQGIYDETSIIVTSDHGEIFDEHARLEHVPPYIKKVLTGLLGRERRQELNFFEPAGWLGHQTVFPYDELVHVPLIVKPGNRSPSLSVYDGLVELIDVFPTIREALDVPIPSDCQGRSLYETIASSEPKEYVFSTSQVHMGNLTYRSVRSHDYKLCLRDWTWPEWNEVRPSLVLKLTALHLLESNELLLATDDHSETPIQDDDTRSRLKDVLSRHRERCTVIARDRAGSPGRIDVGEETRQHLEDLGYK